MPFGDKYKFTPKEGPPPGAYSIETGHSMTKSRSSCAIIREETSPYRRPMENTPGPGHHDGHLTPFGSSVTGNVGMGSKYEFKPDQNPGAGYYDIESGHNASKTKSRAAHIDEEKLPYRRPKENSPGPGHYDGHLDKFGD